MKVLKLILLVLVLLTLTACIGAERVAVETATETLPKEIPTERPTETNAVTAKGETTPTAEITPQDEAEKMEIEEPQEIGEQPVSECTLVSSLPDPPQQFAELFSVQEDDWVIGPEDAAITLIEYGDFQ